jgi:hypothetical protein
LHFNKKNYRGRSGTLSFVRGSMRKFKDFSVGVKLVKLSTVLLELSASMSIAFQKVHRYFPRVNPHKIARRNSGKNCNEKLLMENINYEREKGEREKVFYNKKISC